MLKYQIDTESYIIRTHLTLNYKVALLRVMKLKNKI